MKNIFFKCSNYFVQPVHNVTQCSKIELDLLYIFEILIYVEYLVTYGKNKTKI